jgi:hypothetical protein
MFAVPLASIIPAPASGEAATVQPSNGGLFDDIELFYKTAAAAVDPLARPVSVRGQSRSRPMSLESAL